MNSETITIQLDPESAKAYEAAPAGDTKKMQVLLSLWLRELATAEPATLKEIMSDICRKAQARGLTRDALGSVLFEASTPRRAVDRGMDKGSLLISFPVLAELHHVLGRKQFHKYVEEDEARQFLAALDACSPAAFQQRQAHQSASEQDQGAGLGGVTALTPLFSAVKMNWPLVKFSEYRKPGLRPRISVATKSKLAVLSSMKTKLSPFNGAKPLMKSIAVPELDQRVCAARDP